MLMGFYPGLHNVGAGDIANRTRTIWLPPGQFIATTGSPSRDGSIGGMPADCWALDASSSEAVVAMIVLPAGIVAAGVSATVYWTVADANAGDVAWTVGSRLVAPSSGNINLDAYGPVAGAAPGVTRRPVATTVTSDFFGSATEAAGSITNVLVERTGGDAGDTYAADVYFLGLLLSYTADS